MTFSESTGTCIISNPFAFFPWRGNKNSFCPISSNGLFYTSVNMAHSASTFFPAVSFPFHLFFLHICEIHKSHLIWILFHIFLLYINGKSDNSEIKIWLKFFLKEIAWWCIWFFLIQAEFHFFSIQFSFFSPFNEFLQLSRPTSLKLVTNFTIPSISWACLILYEKLFWRYLYNV